MPKNKKRAKVQKAGGVVVSRPPTDDEYDTADNISTVSHLSDDVVSIAESVNEAEVDEASSQELFEDKLKEYIEGTTQKCTQGRINCLEFIKSALSKKYMDEFLMDRKVTLSENLLKCIKKGKGDEQALAVTCFTLLIIQLGIEVEDIFNEFRPMLLNLLNDHSVALKARSQSTICLSIGSFLACDDIEIVKSVMKSLEDVFRSSYRKGDNSTPNINTDTCQFHSNALQAWCLLLSIAPAFIVNDVIASHLTKIPDLLFSKDLDLKITAGETLALLYELARETDEEFEGDDIERLCELLKNLATDCQKSQARKDRKQQRSSFRDILRAIEEADSPRTLVKFGSEQVLLNSWSRKKQYDIFCHVMGTGVNLHLQFNELLRQIFDLGPVIPVGAVRTKLSKFERNQYKAAAFKARTKARSKHRDKRSVTANCF
ncbi:hypothetical protein LOTGIDRAFT_192392 [Lottia gigantea]|uniref:Interferon-related developmental regulator N-terminal domain-containing protein n=1 Tax=Lottia gigantea TaxID=225164 RepID=V4BLZ7_LOTGI|nr:hypothetical protein LOTGIDRAFT_192392 [Lottia gigantea]ESO89864.1 hypothetical protein LOTGIDRAFT_192392 [Lottia gigantea]